jgi:hypothetical protein
LTEAEKPGDAVYHWLAMSDAPTTMTSLDYRRATQTEVSGRLAPALVGVTFFLGYLFFVGKPNVVDAFARIGISCLPAIVLAILADRVPRMSRILLFAVNLAAVLLCIMPNLLAKVQPGGWTWGMFAGVSAIVGILVAAITTLTQMLHQRDGTALAMLVSIGMTLATAALLLFAGIASMPQYTLTLVLGIVAVLIVGTIHHPLRNSRGIYTIVMAILATQLVSAHLWGADDGMPIWAGAAVIASPLYAWVVRIPWIARRRPWQRIVVGLLVAAIPAAAACALMGTEYAGGWNRSKSNGGDSSETIDSYDTWKP